VIVWLVLSLLAVFGPSIAQADEPPCLPHIVSVAAARATSGDETVPPTAGWVTVELPDRWRKRWPDQNGAVWYRLLWDASCKTENSAPSPVAFRINGMALAGEIRSNDDLLWRDVSLTEPLSRSWNVPRFWVLPETSLHAGTNTIWIRIVAPAFVDPGLRAVELGDIATLQKHHSLAVWQQRTIVIINIGLTAALGAIALAIWCLRRRERAFGWYALMSLAWLLFAYDTVATSPWPFPDSMTWARWIVSAMVLYVCCFCLFTWRFGGQSLPRIEKLLWIAAALTVAVLWLIPSTMADAALFFAFLCFPLIFFANCLQFPWHAWRTRNPQHRLLALAYLTFVFAGVHDMLVVFAIIPDQHIFTPYAGLIATGFMAAVLGGHVASSMRRVEGFNEELVAGIARAREELSQVLRNEHASAMNLAKLEERMQIAHDLHDGLGGSLVRAMAMVERAHEPLSNERMLSLLKLLRDDLRQLVDHDSSSDDAVAVTPILWVAPLRYRFTRVFDEIGIASEWSFPSQWRRAPSALQCLTLTRVVEEALSNAIKHSTARRIIVAGEQPESDSLCLHIEDDGIGFDIDAILRGGGGVGIRSMSGRVARVGGKLDITSQPGRTVLTVRLALA
jgi:two-component system sensor histidine kinase UhpB